MEENVIDLEITQLHYSAKVIYYIKVKKKTDIELTLSQIHKCDNKEYILSVYYDDAFILGALLDDISIRNKISIKGVLHANDNTWKPLKMNSDKGLLDDIDFF